MADKITSEQIQSFTLPLPTHYDEEVFFETEMRPLIEKLRDIAAAHGLPFLVAVGYAHDSKEGFGVAATACEVSARTAPIMRLAMRMLRHADLGRFVLDLVGFADQAAEHCESAHKPGRRVM
jgi:hypothetical protein